MDTDHAAEPPRIEYTSVFPSGARAMVGLQRAIDGAGLEPLLLELVKMRASQINGCAYCLDMHSKDARALGESEQRLHLLAAWREASCYDARERVALAWCEELTLIWKQGAPDAVYEELARTFAPAEIVALTLAIVAIKRLEPAGDLHARTGRRIRLTAPPASNARERRRHPNTTNRSERCP